MARSRAARRRRSCQRTAGEQRHRAGIGTRESSGPRDQGEIDSGIARSRSTGRGGLPSATAFAQVSTGARVPRGPDAGRAVRRPDVRRCAVDDRRCPRRRRCSTGRGRTARPARRPPRRARSRAPGPGSSCLLYTSRSAASISSRSTPFTRRRITAWSPWAARNAPRQRRSSPSARCRSEFFALVTGTSQFVLPARPRRISTGCRRTPRTPTIQAHRRTDKDLRHLLVIPQQGSPGRLSSPGAGAEAECVFATAPGELPTTGRIFAIVFHPRRGPASDDALPPDPHL